MAGARSDWCEEEDLTEPPGVAEDPEYASAGLAWGAKDAKFDTVAEVEQVLGMTPAIYARVAPLPTVYSGQARPDPDFASGEVLQALGEDTTPIMTRRRARVRPREDPFSGGGNGQSSITTRTRRPHSCPTTVGARACGGIGT